MPFRVLTRPFVVFLLTISAAAAAGTLPALPSRPATAEELAMLSDVLRRTADDLRRWAYTEHRVFRDDKGRAKSEQLVRFDPSRPYAEQWTPLKINGKEPSERDQAKFRRRGEQSEKTGGYQPGGRHHRSVGELIDLTRAFVTAETPTHLTFEIPLLKQGNERFPPEKFQVHARIRKDGALLENISVTLREAFRTKLVVKVKSGGGTMEFAQVDPKYPPTMVAISGDASASMFFVNVGGSLELKRTELKHVKPFDERFEVQIGTLKAIDF